ncbi:type III restriction enzyme, res subunit [Thermoproteus uzoniensis 768-20]|uniref:Type III restriction enzyme, res subunit n=1 Tax=Thermoproteus uzoniensis (strain 768-20) TaxID=999630 RepID=F2L487_THEU7|nr:DEAD/DEAH box helicase [Thermoproteus uzoniensis]AEA12143.1 type III restriction enzyme, res subunit [Thermoproteus uzoniensis 768-20]
MEFRVVVNGVEIVREWSWDRISKVKEELKKMGFRWTGGGWVGRLRDPASLYALKALLDLNDEELEEVLKASGLGSGDAILVVGDVPDRLKPYVVASYGSSHLISATRFIRDFVASDKKAIAEAPSYDEYVRRAAEEFKALVRGVEVKGDLEAVVKNAVEIALGSERLKALYEKRMAWRRAELWPTKAVLNFAGRELFAELGNFKLAYNIVGKDGEVKQVFIKLIRASRENNKVIITYPVFIRDKISEILRKYGYIVVKKDLEYKQVQYKQNISLYDFQKRAVDSWERAGRRGTIAVPTGGGKTFIAMAALARASTTALILAVTQELAAQWAERLRRHLGVSPGMLGAGKHDVRDVTVAIYNSAVKYVDELVGKFGVVVFDEAHHVPAETFKEIALALDSPFRLAISATPKREDGNELLIYEAVGPLVYRATYTEMIEAGLVVPVEHYRIYIKPSPEEEQEYRSVQSTTDNAIVLRNIASQISSKIPIAVEIVKREVALGHKVLVFTQFLEQAKAVYDKLREESIRSELITSEERDRSSAFSRFLSGAAKVVVTTTVLDEGVDVPDADVAVIVSGSGSKRQMLQRVGRVVRRAPGKSVARVYELIARGTIEEALSESRHVDDVIEESVCRKFSEQTFREFLRSTRLTDFRSF